MGSYWNVWPPSPEWDANQLPVTNSWFPLMATEGSQTCDAVSAVATASSGILR